MNVPLRALRVIAFLTVALFVVLGVALINSSPGHWAGMPTAGHWSGVILTLFLFGTATVTYLTPVSGTTPPTAAQMQNADTVRATVLMGDTDTTATVTHNFAEGTTGLALGYPDYTCYPETLTSVSETSPPILTFTRASNALTITKVSAVGSGGLWLVRLARPSSIGN